MLLAVPKYGQGQGQQDPGAVPDLSEQDDRRPIGAPARGARLLSPEVAASGSRPLRWTRAPTRRACSWRRAAVRHHRPLRRRQGDADRASCSDGCRGSSCRSRPPRAPRGKASGTGSTTTSWPRRSSTGASRTGEFMEHAAYSGHRYGTLALRGRAAARPRASAWCSRSRFRARARSGSGSRTPCWSSSLRRSPRRCGAARGPRHGQPRADRPAPGGGAPRSSRRSASSGT